MTSDSQLAAILVAGQSPLSVIMDQLRTTRPVFHSEADLQHSFARTLWEVKPSVQVRLEVPAYGPPGRRRMDLLCISSTGRTAIEVKYFQRPWRGTVGPFAEAYELTAHVASDLARLGFITDVTRLEDYCSTSNAHGLALLVTNEPSLWTVPSWPVTTRDREFRIHDGRLVTGALQWGGRYEPNGRTVRGRYRLAWREYSMLPGKGGEFRYLAVSIDPAHLQAGAQTTAE